jgi:hypothetical protein
MALKNIFGNHIKTREVEDITTLLTTTKERIEECVKNLTNKYDLGNFRCFSRDIIPKIEDKISTIIHKLEICENNLQKMTKYS